VSCGSAKKRCAFHRLPRHFFAAGSERHDRITPKARLAPRPVEGASNISVQIGVIGEL